jgi:hypothetical protein
MHEHNLTLTNLSELIFLHAAYNSIFINSFHKHQSKYQLSIKRNQKTVKQTEIHL